MRKNLISLACAGILLVSGLAMTAASYQPVVQQDPAKDQAPTVTVAGKLSSVAPSAVVVVDDQKAETTIVLDGATKIEKAGKEVAVADLKAEDVVTVVARKGEGDMLTAIKIIVV